MNKFKWILVAIGVVINLVAGTNWGWKIFSLIFIIGVMELMGMMGNRQRRRAVIKPMKYGRRKVI